VARAARDKEGDADVDDALNLTLPDSVAPANITPSSTPRPALAPDAPPGTITVPMQFTPGAVAALRHAGFLATDLSSPDHLAEAVFAKLAEAWKAGVRTPTAVEGQAGTEAPAP
jgi:hypothetical protein